MSEGEINIKINQKIYLKNSSLLILTNVQLIPKNPKTIRKCQQNLQPQMSELQFLKNIDIS